MGIARLTPGTRIVLCGGAHPAVKTFLALYRDEFPLIERRSVDIEAIQKITVVDAQKKEQFGLAAEWLDAPHVEIEVWDHHLSQETDINAGQVHLENVGATTTLMVERCQRQSTRLSIADLTVMALGIHVDTGSLTYEGATSRDAQALAWLMAQGANQKAIADYIEPGFSEELQTLLGTVLRSLHTEEVHGHRLAWVVVETPAYVPGLSSLASQLLILNESDACLLGHIYRSKAGGPLRFTVIGRSRIDALDLSDVLGHWGGGGHAQAAALTVKEENPNQLMADIVTQLKTALPIPPTARALMSSPVRTIRPDSTIDQARRILLRYGHSGLSVVNETDRLVGVISRRDLDIALHHGFGHAPVKGYMTSPVKTITPETTLPEIEALMVRLDIGRLPVVQNDALLGIVTRTDILRQLHQLKPQAERDPDSISRAIQSRLKKAMPSKLYELLTVAAQEAEKRQWQLYLVGGAVRDFLLTARGGTPVFKEFDLVVDGVLNAEIESVGGELAESLLHHFPKAQLQIYGQFQTAALIWHRDCELGPFSMDIATARSEFYPYPAANPEVSISSVRQDLYRRDFTINALAIRLTTRPQTLQDGEELLDFFGGIDDLKQRQIRVLHPNSFIEDPTRIFRAIRFASRLGFELGEQTRFYMQNAIASGVYHAADPDTDRPALQSRLRNELKYIFQEAHWRNALDLMESTDALSCLHPDLHLTEQVKEEIAIAVQWQSEIEAEPERWLMVVQVLLTQLEVEVRSRIAAQLNLPEKVQKRLKGFDRAMELASSQLNETLKPSQVVKLLKGLDDPLVVLCGVRCSIQCHQNLLNYLKTWKNTPPILNGNDLIELGYKPGREFKVILEFVLDATLDGMFTEREDAIAMVKQKFPC